MCSEYPESPEHKCVHKENAGLCAPKQVLQEEKKNIPLSTPQRSQKQNSEAAHIEAKVAAQHTCILTFATALSERYPAAMLPTRPPISKALM